jgi:uroporphyrinogen-III synthase
LNGRTIAFLEARLGDHLAEMIRRRGGLPFAAPALAEEPDVDPAEIRRLIDDWRAHPAKVAIFQTGVGTRALFAATDALAITPALLQLLAATIVVVRGPKPTAALRQRGVRIDRAAAEPFTTTQVLDALDGVELSGETVVVQRYGEINSALNDALAARGATAIDVPTYRWTLPADTQPLRRLIDSTIGGEMDAVVFTSASQVVNLFTVADRLGRATELRLALNATLIASIGPVCSAALRRIGVEPALEAHPPKLGPLLDALETYLDTA